MVRFPRGLEVRQVARHAGMRQSGIYAVTMTRLTADCVMRSGQWEAGMVELGTTPAGRTVTVLAIVGPALGQVVGITRALHVVLMTRSALNRCPDQVANLCAGVAAKAGNSGVGSHQWETRLIVQKHLSLRLPVILVVTLATLRAELSAVRIRVTTSATASGKGRHRAAVIVTPKTGG